MKRTILTAIIACAAALIPAAVLAFPAADPDEISAVAADECQARPVQGGIELAAASELAFEIYSITGQRIKIATVNGSSLKVDLPKGCYIVRCSKWSKKVVVK